MRDSRRTVNDSYLLTLLAASFLSFRKTRFAARYRCAVIFPPPPFCPPFFFDFFIPASTPPVRSVFHHPRPFIFSQPLLPSAGTRTNPLGSAPLANPLGYLCSRILWEIASHGSFGKSLLTDPLGNRFSRIRGHSITTPVTEWFSPFFFEPSRASEARCRRQEPREGVPKRTGACERGGEARRREPWWEVNDHLPNNRCATPVGL